MTSAPIWHSRGYIPHFDDNCSPQHITFRLADSVPANVLADLEQELCYFPQSKYEVERRLRIEKLIDQGRGSCILQQPSVASIVQNALLFFDQQRYRLHAWAIMPNHVHVLMSPISGWPISSLMHSWKSYTAHVINRSLGKQGTVWQKEYFDRVIRNELHFAKCLEYIEHNPVSAGLCSAPQDWLFGSARLRLENGVNEFAL